MKKFLRSLLVSAVLGLSILTPPFISSSITHAQDQEIAYVGSSKATKYHYPSCRWAQKIKPSNLVTFTSKEDASDKGYIPCKVCRP